MTIPGKKALPWLVVMALGITGAGAAIGTVLSGNVTGNMPTTVSQAIVIDAANFDIGDLSSHAARRFVGVSDDATSFIAAAEISTGEELVINLPLGNNSDEDALALFTVDAPSPLQVYVREFWDTVTKTDTPSVHAQITTPSPAPITSTLPQTYDADPNVTYSPPSGSATIQDNPANLGTAHYGNPGGAPTPSPKQANTTSTTGAVNRPAGATQIDTTLWWGWMPGSPFFVNLPFSQSGTYYWGKFSVDVDGDGAPDDIYFVLSDQAWPGGTYDTMAISMETLPNPFGPWNPDPYVDFAETNPLDLIDGLVSDWWTVPSTAPNDERLDSSHPQWPGPYETIQLGTYTFELDFDPDPWADTNDARITPVNSTIQIDTTLWWGWMPGSPFFVNLPFSQSGTYYWGKFSVDVDGDGAPDDIYFVLSDQAWPGGTYDTMAISMETLPNPFGPWNPDPYVDFAETNPLDLIDGLVSDWWTVPSTAPNDERLDSSHPQWPGPYETIQLGTYTFEVDFDPDPNTDGNDARITSVEWWQGTFTNIDLDADGNDPAIPEPEPDDTVYFVLSDIDSDGVYENMDISTDDSTYYETTPPPPPPGTTFSDNITGTDDDETIPISGDTVRLGSYYSFNLWGVASPSGVPGDATLQNTTWYTGSLLMDIDADGTDPLNPPNDTVAFCLTDTDSDGRYDTLDISTDDGALPINWQFGEGTLFGQSPRQTGPNPPPGDDERLGIPPQPEPGGGNYPGGSADVRLGAYYLFTVAFDNNPPNDGSDVRIKSKTWL